MQTWQASTLSVTVTTDDPHAAKRTFNNIVAEVNDTQITALGTVVSQLANAPFTTAVLKTTTNFII